MDLAQSVCCFTFVIHAEDAAGLDLDDARDFSERYKKAMLLMSLALVSASGSL